VELGIIERRASNLADVTSSFGRLFSNYSGKKPSNSSSMSGGEAAEVPLFAVSANLTPRALVFLLAGTVITHLQWRFKHYYDAELLVLAQVLDPSRHVRGLRHHSGDYAARESLIVYFMELCVKLWMPSKSQTIDNPDAPAETIQTAMYYFEDGGALSVNSLPAGASKAAHVVEAVARWALTVDQAGTALPTVAQHLLSVPAHAAELERA